MEGGGWGVRGEGEVREVVLVGGGGWECTMHKGGGKGGEGVKGEGHAQEIENREHSAYSLGSGR